jgi:hypothetical protein
MVTSENATVAGFGEVAEWPKAAVRKDCYTVRPYRRFESFPSPQ